MSYDSFAFLRYRNHTGCPVQVNRPGSHSWLQYLHQMRKEETLMRSRDSQLHFERSQPSRIAEIVALILFVLLFIMAAYA